MVTNVIFKHFGYEAVNAASHGCQQHQYICTMVASGQNAFDGINLSANPPDAGDELLFFLVDMRRNFLIYTIGGYHTNMDKMRISFPGEP